MERFKRTFLLVVSLVLVTGLTTSCGDDDKGGKGGSEPTLWSQATVESRYVCQTPELDTEVTLELRNSESPKVRGDQLAKIYVESAKFYLELDLLLGMRFRSDRDVIEVREALQVRNSEVEKSDANIFVVNEPEFAPHVMNLNIAREEMEIISGPLKRLIRSGLEVEFNERFEVQDRERDRGTQRGNQRRKPLFLDCELR